LHRGRGGRGRQPVQRHREAELDTSASARCQLRRCRGEPSGRGRRERGRAWGVPSLRLQLGGDAERRRTGCGHGARPQEEIRLVFASGCWRAQVFGCVVFLCARPKPTNGSRICIPSAGDSLMHHLLEGKSRWHSGSRKIFQLPLLDSVLMVPNKHPYCLFRSLVLNKQLR
jgi:hypothetical protein